MPDYGPQVDRWLSEKGVNLTCTQCGNESFGGGEALVEFHAPAEEGMMVYTAVPIMCQKCGHFELFSANLIGLVRD